MAQTLANSKFSVCAIPQNVELTQAGYEALAWTPVGGWANLGETGKKTNILTYNLIAAAVVDKGKGLTDAGSPQLEVSRIPNDPGQVILRSAAAIGNNANTYAFKLEYSDSTVIGGTGSVFYMRGYVGGPTRPNGGNEDFIVEIYDLGLVQVEIEVPAAGAGVAPFVTAIPTLTGTFTVGQIITSTNGTWSGDATIVYTREWFANNIRIPNQTATTYTLVAGDLGKRITARVTAANGAGNASSTTAPSAAVA